MKTIEKSIISSSVMAIDDYPNNAAMMLAELSQADFSDTHGRNIYAAIRSLHNSGIRIDAITVADYLDERIKHGGMSGETLQAFYDCASFMEAYPSMLHDYIEQLKNERIAKETIRYLKDAILAAENGEPCQGFIAKAMEASTSDTESYMHTAAELVPLALASYTNDDVSGVLTGYDKLDAAMHGFHNQDLIIIGAYTGAGKSTLAVNIAANMCRAGKNVLYFSAEMNGTETIRRVIEAEAESSREDIKANVNGSAEKALTAGDWIAPWGFTINDKAGITIGEIEAASIAANARKHLDCIFVDYLQIIEADVKSNTRADVVAHISRRLKRLAQRVDCPIVAMAQVGREVAMGEDHTPKLHNLRESAAIAQDANVVLLLHRESAIDFEYTGTDAQLQIAKNRNGISGIHFDLEFASSITRYYEAGKMPAKYRN